MNVQMKENMRVSSRSTLPAWFVIYLKELEDLWSGGKALVLIFIYTMVLGVATYIIASNGNLKVLSPKEMMFETIETIIEVNLFIGLIISADSFSGERERNTLESMLLTPSSRRQIVAGKFLAAITFWPLAFLIAIPMAKLLSQGDAVFSQGLFWGAILGSVLVLIYVGLGILVSLWSNTSKTSYVVALGIYTLFLIPAELHDTAQTGLLAHLLQWINPIAAVNHFLSKTLLNNVGFSELWVWIQAPVVFAILIHSVLFLYAAPGLRLEQGQGSNIWLRLRQTLR